MEKELIVVQKNNIEENVRENINRGNEDAMVLDENGIPSTGVNEESKSQIENENEQDLTERENEIAEIVDETEVDAEKYKEDNTSTREKVNKDEEIFFKCSFIRGYASQRK